MNRIGPTSTAMVRALGLLYIGGPSVAVACQLLPHSPATDTTAIWVMVVIAYSMVPVLFTQYTRLPLWAVGGVIALANTLVTSVVYFNHEASSSYAYFYLWVTPYAVVFFSTRVVLAHLLYPAVAYAVILAVLHGDGHPVPGNADVAQWLQVTAALAVTALLVRALSHALREGLERIEDERRRRALEINDDVVQQLVLARHATTPEDRDAALATALDRARAIMGGLVEARPGGLRRAAGTNETPAPPSPGTPPAARR